MKRTRFRNHVTSNPISVDLQCYFLIYNLISVGDRCHMDCGLNNKNFLVILGLISVSIVPFDPDGRNSP